MYMYGFAIIYKYTRVFRECWRSAYSFCKVIRLIYICMAFRRSCSYTPVSYTPALKRLISVWLFLQKLYALRQHSRNTTFFCFLCRWRCLCSSMLRFSSCSAMRLVSALRFSQCTGGVVCAALRCTSPREHDLFFIFLFYFGAGGVVCAALRCTSTHETRTVFNIYIYIKL
jgi:hypothetical protein